MNRSGRPSDRLTVRLSDYPRSRERERVDQGFVPSSEFRVSGSKFRVSGSESTIGEHLRDLRFRNPSSRSFAYFAVNLPFRFQPFSFQASALQLFRPNP